MIRFIHWNILVVVIRSIQRRKEEVSTCMFVIIRDPQTVRNRSILVRGSLNIIFYAETYSENLYVYQEIIPNSAFIIQHHLLRLPKWPLEPQNGPKSKLFVALSCTLHRAICIDYCRVSNFNKK